MTAHTKGPFRYDTDALGCRSIYAMVKSPGSQRGYRREIACTVGLSNDEEDKANARLLAASATMYEALVAVLPFLLDAGGEAHNIAATAIAEAKAR